MNLLVALLCCDTCGLLNQNSNRTESPKIVIVGAGAAGIAAASRLFENGFTDVTILEAENRIGGRIHSVEFGDYMVDMGAQWVHGEKNNAVFKLAWPLGLLERFEENYNTEVKYFDSSGFEFPPDVSRNIQHLEGFVTEAVMDGENKQPQSFGENAKRIFYEHVTDHTYHLDMFNLSEPLLHSFEMSEMISDGGGYSWHELSVNRIRNYAECEGDKNLNWKNRTYSTILDILMKKYPNPNNELPVFNNIYMNSKVTKIDYEEIFKPVKVSTANGNEYLADHVIFTPSLGVLRASHSSLFNPRLQEKKVKTIQNSGYGYGAKIYFYYENPWWTDDGDKYVFRNILWTEEDKKKIMQGDPNKSWMLGVHSVIPVEHKPKLLCLWMTSVLSILMESISDEVLHSDIMELLNKFYGQSYNITEPTKIIRSTWNINENFYGTYSFPSLEAEMTNVDYKDLAEPIRRNNKPIMQFAGEATSKHYSTVHGAIDSGWREADRIINLYPKQNCLSKLLKQLGSSSEMITH